MLFLILNQKVLSPQNNVILLCLKSFREQFIFYTLSFELQAEYIYFLVFSVKNTLRAIVGLFFSNFFLSSFLDE